MTKATLLRNTARLLEKNQPLGVTDTVLTNMVDDGWEERRERKERESRKERGKRTGREREKERKGGVEQTLSTTSRGGECSLNKVTTTT